MANVIQQLDERTYETQSGNRTLTLQIRDGYCHVLSHFTSDPSFRYAWGCKTFSSVAEVDAKYKAFRGIAALVEAR